MNLLKCLLPTILLFFLLDCLWIGFIAQSFYLSHLSSVLNIQDGSLTARLAPGVFVYICFAIMIWCVVLPLAQWHIMQAFLYGALLGFIIYGIYDMTNMAVLKEWPFPVALLDICWGTFLCSITSGVCGTLYQHFNA